MKIFSLPFGLGKHTTTIDTTTVPSMTYRALSFCFSQRVFKSPSVGRSLSRKKRTLFSYLPSSIVDNTSRQPAMDRHDVRLALYTDKFEVLSSSSQVVTTESLQEIQGGSQGSKMATRRGTRPHRHMGRQIWLVELPSFKFHNVISKLINRHFYPVSLWGIYWNGKAQ